MYEVTEEKGYIRIKGGESFSPRNTFESGQCFRWLPSGDGGYFGIASKKPCRIWQEEDGFCMTCTKEDFETFWKSYLDLERSYEEIAAGLPKDDFTQKAVKYGLGLRILRQEPWEALCSFIISQCNNIPRIQKIISALCDCLGDDIFFEGKIYKSFPSAEKIADAGEKGLAFTRAGYRIPYIVNAANMVAQGKVDFGFLDRLDIAEAEKYIMRLPGVGRKVADCFLLFGMGKLDAFPVDTWMKKAAPFYPGGFDAGAFGSYAGIAQQYIFFYTRENKIGKSVDKPENVI